MRAPWPGLAESVTEMRSAISALVTSPLAASRSRTATSSLSPSVSRTFMFDHERQPALRSSWPDLIRPSDRLQPMFVDLHQQFIARPAFLPHRRLVERDVVERSGGGRPREGEVLRVGIRTKLTDHLALHATQVMRRADVDRAARLRPVVLHTDCDARREHRSGHQA